MFKKEIVMKMIVGLIALKSIASHAECNIKFDYKNYNISYLAVSEIVTELSAKKYKVRLQYGDMILSSDFEGKPNQVLDLDGFAGGGRWSVPKTTFGVYARVYDANSVVAEAKAVRSGDYVESYVFGSSWHDPLSIESVKNLGECKY